MLQYKMSPVYEPKRSCFRNAHRVGLRVAVERRYKWIRLRVDSVERIVFHTYS